VAASRSRSPLKSVSVVPTSVWECHGTANITLPSLVCGTMMALSPVRNDRSNTRCTPWLGAMIGAGVVFLFFAVTAEQFATLSGIARWTDVASTLGIMAVAVALLMIGGEFDLSSGVMTGSAGLLMGILATEVGMNIWLAILLTFVFAACVGFINGTMVIKTGLPSFIVTLATFFILQGVNLGGTKAITDTVRVGGLRDTAGFESAQKIFASDFWDPHNYRVSVIWWIVITALATWVTSAPPTSARVSTVPACVTCRPTQTPAPNGPVPRTSWD